MNKKILFSATVVMVLILPSCSNTADQSATAKDSINNVTTTKTMIKEDAVNYTSGSANLKGYVYFDESKSGKRPVVLVVPEWWGLTNYPRTRAKQLAELGYLAMAVDMYGDGKLAADPKEAMAMASPFYANPQMAADRLNAAADKAKSYPQADSTQVAAIGYCFGGTAVLNAARLGADLKGVVSFHGDFPKQPIEKEKWKGKVLICHGEADQFVTMDALNGFTKKLDSVGVPHTVKTYPGATHAFTNPDATANGKKFNMPIAYNAPADTASWNEMKTFFGTIFK